MDITKFTWNGFLFYADILIQKGILEESQIKIIIDLVDIKSVVKNNILSEEFIKDEILPRIDEDEYDSLDLYKINSYQEYLKYNKNKK
jgi:hypothetical protein